MQPSVLSTRTAALFALTCCLIVGCDDAANGDPLNGALDASTPNDATVDDAAMDAALPDAGMSDVDSDVPVEPDPDDPSLAWGPTATVGSDCVPPPLLRLEDIPNDPSLDDDNPDTGAVFEVDGHSLIGKHVTDVAAAEGGLRLWQELALRFPENQLRDLVQYEVFSTSDPVATFNRTNAVTTQRNGLKIGFSAELIDKNDPDPCAPLVPRRGTFDWSLVHEMGHVRGWLDGSWTRFISTFPDVSGPGDGFPEDGSPVLDRAFVTSYAERDDGDEDHAESWTTFVMLPESAIPAMMADEPLAASKVRWMYDQPGLRALRQAVRITESDGGNVVVTAAPRLDEEQLWADYREAIDNQNPPVDAIVNPAWLQGTWRGRFEFAGVTYEQEFKITADSVIDVRRDANGAELHRFDLATLMADDRLVLRYIDYPEDALYGWSALIDIPGTDDRIGYSTDFVQWDGTKVLWGSGGGAINDFSVQDIDLLRVAE